MARLARLARRLDADVIHTNSLHSLYGWAAAVVSRRPHVWHAREVVVQSGAALRLERFLCRHFATRVIAVSYAVAAQLDPANVVVLDEHLDVEEFAPPAPGASGRGSGFPTTHRRSARWYDSTRSRAWTRCWMRSRACAPTDLTLAS